MKFGVREICNVVFKTTSAYQTVGTKTFTKAGMPAFHIDTATTSSLEQASNTVYAQGGRGYNRLIAWEGEKTMTFTLEDALISPQGLAVLTGAGLIPADEENTVHLHLTMDVSVKEGEGTITLSDLRNETYNAKAAAFYICNTSEVPIYATSLDGSGAGIDFALPVSITSTNTSASVPNTIAVDKDNAFTFKICDDDGTPNASANGTYKIDFYVVMNSGATQVTIEPSDFGGYFYVEADTLFRREDTGKDMAATITLPKVKVQSAFTFTMAASGDPSTFTFTMDAFPSYTHFDKSKKVICTMEILGSDSVETEDSNTHPEHYVKKASTNSNTDASNTTDSTPDSGEEEANS